MDVPAKLEALLSRVDLLVSSTRGAVSAELRAAGRSRAARLVAALPAGAERAADAAARDLPACAPACALASAAAFAAEVRAGRSRAARAVRHADVAMVLLGMPRARAVRDAVEWLEEAAWLGWGGAGVAADADPAVLGRRDAAPPANAPAGHAPAVPRALAAGSVAEVAEQAFGVERFATFFRADTPVVIRGCAAGWRAVREWKSPRYWMDKCGGRTVPVEWTVGGEMTERFCEVGELVRAMLSGAGEGGAKVYLAQHPLFEYVRALEADVEQPRYLRAVGKETADLTNVWMGTAGSGSKLHYDSADNLLVQVVGEKRVVLVAPEYGKNLYAGADRPNVSPVDVETPDLERFPRFGKVRGEMVELKPGDALYIPATHWHWVKSLTSSISVNFWF